MPIRATPSDPDPKPATSSPPSDPGPDRPACPACGGPTFEIRGKLQCSRCRTICETCCEGGRG